MTPPRLRLTFAALAATVLALSACAVPGQPANPGTAAILGNHEVTNQQLDRISQAWVEDTHGLQVPPSRRHILTVELMRPHLEQALVELGFEVDGEAAASQWLAYVQARGQQAGAPQAELIVPEQPSPELVNSVMAYAALAIIAWTEPDHERLRAIAEDVEANAVLSPRSGQFSAELFVEELRRAEASVLAQQLQVVFYTEYQNVNGFVDTERDWLERD